MALLVMERKNFAKKLTVKYGMESPWGIKLVKAPYGIAIQRQIKTCWDEFNYLTHVQAWNLEKEKIKL